LGDHIIEKLTGNLLFGKLVEVIDLALVWRTRTVPEEKPLQAFISLEFVFEAKDVIFVGEFEEI
jgi:hypothetical protein